MSGAKKRRKAPLEEIEKAEKELFLKAFFEGEIPKAKEKLTEIPDTPEEQNDDDLFVRVMEKGLPVSWPKENNKNEHSMLRPKNRAQRRKLPDATIDLHGMSVLEATKAMQKFLEQEIKRGSKTVRVIHGKGSGALRDAVWSLIENHPMILDFQVPAAKLGGGGALILRLSHRPNKRRNF